LRRLLAVVSWTHLQQADGNIHGDQLLQFLVNILTDAFSVELGENTEIDPEDLDFVPLRRQC
jgi:hypothetical protein